MSGFELTVELNDKRKTLDLAITELKKRGSKKAEKERNYRVELAKEILIQRNNGVPVTIINDICKGNESLADLRMERDIAKTLYETCMQKIYQCKLEISLIEKQMTAERKGQ